MRRTWFTRAGPVGGVPLVVGVCALGGATTAQAKPSGPEVFCNTYPEAPACSGRLPNCTLCHVSSDEGAVTWNAYGQALVPSINGGPFDELIVPAMEALEEYDIDGDGVSNIEEIELGTGPGDKDDVWEDIPVPEGLPNPQFDVGAFDFAFALRRVSLTFCGRSPTYGEMTQMRAENEVSAQRDLLRAKLAECLDSAYWIEDALGGLADPRVRPVREFGFEATGLADYNYDYDLFRYALTDNRDARDLLVADYHVLRDGGGNLVVADESELGGGESIGPQVVMPSRRAGLLTTQWFLFLNTMFSEIPRTTAAMAYRAYLGMDVAKQEGLFQGTGQLIDYDGAGVDEGDCATCHRALDPLAYEFTYYRGIGEGPGQLTGEFVADRPEELGLWSDTDAPTGSVLDQPVSSLMAWAAVAADSEAFRRNLAQMAFELMMGRAPWPDELPEITDAYEGAVGSGGAVRFEEIIASLVEAEGFGTP